MIICILSLYLYALLLAGPSTAASKQKPNIVIIFTDDQGYVDVGYFGSVNIKTSHLDRMADESMKFTDFYVAAPACTPSRAGLMTGYYPQRLSMTLMPRGDKGDGVKCCFPIHRAA
jgi:arylsulfatase A